MHVTRAAGVASLTQSTANGHLALSTPGSKSLGFLDAQNGAEGTIWTGLASTFASTSPVQGQISTCSWSADGKLLIVARNGAICIADRYAAHQALHKAILGFLAQHCNQDPYHGIAAAPAKGAGLTHLVVFIHLALANALHAIINTPVYCRFRRTARDTAFDRLNLR